MDTSCTIRSSQLMLVEDSNACSIQSMPVNCIQFPLLHYTVLAVFIADSFYYSQFLSCALLPTVSNTCRFQYSDFTKFSLLLDSTHATFLAFSIACRF